MADMAVTNFLDVYEYAFTEIEDVRLDNLMSENPALFLRRCWDYLRNAIPLFTAPKGMQDKLKDYEQPQFDSQSFVGDGTSTAFAGSPGMADVTILIGEVVVAVLSASEASPIATQNGVSYDFETGTIEFDVAPEADADIQVDYYTDGYFNRELSVEEIAILAKCFSVVWFNKIANTFLRTTPKIKDKNFNTDSSFGVEQADTAKLRAMRIELQDMMSDYEQTMAYKVVVPTGKQLLNRYQNG